MLLNVQTSNDATPGVALQKRYAKIRLKYVGHENAGYIKFSVFA